MPKNKKQIVQHYNIEGINEISKKYLIVALIDSITDYDFLNKLIRYVDLNTNHPATSGYIDLFGEYRS